MPVLADALSRPWRMVSVYSVACGGSKFFQSLLDGHPGILMLPFSSLGHGFFDMHWPCGTHGRIPLVNACKVFMPVFSSFFSSTSPVVTRRMTTLGETGDRSAFIDPEAFSQAFNGLAQGTGYISRRSFFILVHLAYWLAMGHRFEDLPERPLILFPAHSYEESLLCEMRDDFPDLTVLHATRRPVQNLGSCIKWLSAGPFPGIQSSLKLLFNDGRAFDTATHAISRAVRLEDLHLRPREALSAVCRFLEIEWDDMLMRSTINGHDWYVSYDGEKTTSMTWTPGAKEGRVTGFHTRSIAKTHDDIFSDLDVARLEAVFSDYDRVWRYIPKWSLTLDQALDDLDRPFKFVDVLLDADMDTKKRFHASIAEFLRNAIRDIRREGARPVIDLMDRDAPLQGEIVR